MLDTQFIQEKFEERGGRPSYPELGEILGCSASLARLYVKGFVERPSLVITLRLAQFLGVSVEELLTEEYKKSADSHKSAS